MKCIRCGSENIGPSELMYECHECGCVLVAEFSNEDLIVVSSESK